MLNISLNRSQLNHGTLRVPWFSLGLACLVTLLHFSGPAVFEVLIFDKSAIMRGEIWRFISGHFVHCNLDHLFWDVFAFTILGAVIEINSPKHFLPSLIVSCAAVSSWLLLAETKFSTYCGLSGALNGLLVLAAMIKLKSTGNGIFVLLLAGTLAKIFYEITFGRTLFTSLSSQAIFGAHAVGFAAGIIYVWGLSLKGRQLFQLAKAWRELEF